MADIDSVDNGLEPTGVSVLSGAGNPDKNIQTFLAGITRSSWNPANTMSFMPRVVTGWADSETYREPHIVVTAPIDTPLRGGDTGFTGQSSSGVPVSRILGQVVVQCVAHEEMDLNINSKDVVFSFRQELRRIIGENTLNPNSHFNWITFFSSTGIIDGVRRPILHRQDCVIRYMYEERVFV